jgi:hypothetical protein
LMGWGDYSNSPALSVNAGGRIGFWRGVRLTLTPLVGGLGRYMNAIGGYLYPTIKG